ncbi:MAG: undecaprenyl/decaprenyl-phosphate alpha-N-acetylglucosaminyl 1-phosphate transferase [Syntrophomonadaceae bacterium]|nr:undecaprenyl/decaprenyl-phosphate alpha-N-acetylglucosaminyl 1-phosphate transferase [Syntrophomonadaceae bacterium]
MPLIPFLAAFVVTMVLMPLVIKLSYKIGAVDRPNGRKVHSTTMPRLGGVAIFLSFGLCLILFFDLPKPFWGIVWGALIIFLTGVLDDIMQISPRIKLIGQIAAATVAISSGIVVEFVTNPFNGLLNLGYFSIPLTMLWIVGISNAINLIDGLDGLAAGVSGIAAATMGIIAYFQGQSLAALAAFLLLAAILGFLPYNFYPARTFMGDGGSNFLGFILGCLAIMGTAKSATLISLLVPIVILGIPIFDTFFAIIRRIYNKAPIFMPDKDHLHHRLMAIGLSHRRSVVIIYMISALFGVVAVVLNFIQNPKLPLLLILMLLIIVLGADRIGMIRTRAKDRVKTTGKPHNVEL